MSIVVMKFGGAAVASPQQFAQIADIVLKRSQQAKVVVVVSAMGDTTDQLLALARQVHPTPPLREQDMLISVGERISISLLAMAMQLKGKFAVSLTGSQSGIITTADHSNAQIIHVRPERILRALSEEAIVIVAGFQGVSQFREITTLGRGGSDTSAVALGIALGAAQVEFYKDVLGVYDRDPTTCVDAKVFACLSYAEMLELAERGAEVLHPRAVSLAQKNGLPLHVRSFLDPELERSQGTWIRIEGRELTAPIYE